MNVLLIGSGGREHALAWAISASPLLGAALLRARQCRHRRGRRVRRPRRRPTMPPSCASAASATSASSWSARRRRWWRASPTISPPPASRRSARPRPPPSSRARRASPRISARELGIPTAAYGRFTDARSAKAYLASQRCPIVVKADGLAAGKGVVDRRDAGAGRRRRRRPASPATFGAAGAEVVIEEFLEGEEASFFALVDGSARAAARHAPRTTSASSTATPAPTPAAWAPTRRPRS